MSKPSVYLTEKCQVLKKVLTFFLDSTSGYCRSVTEKRVVFLAQIDFWDWEMDELIFSFDQFDERSKVWQSEVSLTDSLANRGILVRNSVLRDISEKRWRREVRYRPVLDNDEITYVRPETEYVTAPLDELNVVIRRWNKLLEMCEQNVLEKEKLLKSATEFGRRSCLI